MKNKKLLIISIVMCVMFTMLVTSCGKKDQEEAQTVKEETQTVQEETQTVQEDAQTVKEETQTVKEETQKVQEETQTVKEEAQQVQEDSQTVKEETQQVQEETQTVKEEAQKDLTLSSWLPPSHPIVAGMIKPWAENIKNATDGRVNIKVLAKGLGHPKAHFDIAKNGLADVAYTCNNYSPGRFLLSSGVELPFLGDSAEALSVAYWKTYKKFFEKGDEYKGVKLLGVFTHGPGQIHNSKKEIKSVADFKGMKFRVSGGIAAEVAKTLGIIGIQKPASKSYEILSRGVADGILLPQESIKSFKLLKVVPYTTLVPGGLYNVAFYLVMNNKTFDSFSDSDKDAVMAESGEKFAVLAGKEWDRVDKIGLEEIKDAGNSVTIASPEFVSEIKAATKDVEAGWVEKANAKGVDGAAALQYFREAAKNYK